MLFVVVYGGKGCSMVINDDHRYFCVGVIGGRWSLIGVSSGHNYRFSLVDSGSG